MNGSAPALRPCTAIVVEQLWQPVPGGSGTYIRELIHALNPKSVQLQGISARHPDLPDPAAVGLDKIPVFRAALPRPVLYEAWNWLGAPRAESLTPRAQVVHATTWAIPPTRLPLVVTVHDLAFLREPAHFTRRGAAYFKRALTRTRQQAQRIIAPSLATADDCLKVGIPAAHISVIPHGVHTQEVSPAQVDRFRTQHGLTREYVLWVGTREPRKNLDNLLRAFTLLAPRLPELDLVLVGPSGWGADASATQLATHLKERVHVLGHLPTAQLGCAYKGARAFCFPSLWEGFGLPVLEAMAYGTPVVTSRGTCLAEVCADAGLLADPHNPVEIAAQIEQATTQAHDDLSRAGKTRAASFTWQASASAHAQIYQELAT